MPPDQVRKSHIKKFLQLSPEKRLVWALEAGWSIQNALTPEAKLIKEKFRHGGKRFRQQLREMKLECDRPIDRADVALLDEYITIRNSEN